MQECLGVFCNLAPVRSEPRQYIPSDLFVGDDSILSVVCHQKKKPGLILMQRRDAF